MRLFLDTSVLLAASGSAKGASRELFRLAPLNGWVLVSAPYSMVEVERNLSKLGGDAVNVWRDFRPQLLVMTDVLTVELPTVFPVAKDRPILFSAHAWADVLLTLDQGDFGVLLGESFYGMPILKPGSFLIRERVAGRLISA